MSGEKPTTAQAYFRAVKLYELGIMCIEEVVATVNGLRNEHGLRPLNFNEENSLRRSLRRSTMRREILGG